MVEMAPDPELESGTSVAVELRQARETQGLALSDVANRTRIPVRHLAAIESGDYQSLPAATYSAGFVKSYARVLGLDGEPLSRRFREEIAGREAASQRYEPYEPADPARTPSRWLAWSTFVLAILLVLAFLYWRGLQTSENPAAIATQSQTAPPPAPAAAPVVQQPAPVSSAADPSLAPPAAAPAPGATALLTAEQPVWLRITDGEAKLYEGMMKPGESFTIPASAADPRLRTSRATALKVTVGSTTIPPLGPPETLIKNVSLAPKDLLAVKPAP
ncbi:transcriptional regulator with XRE-family HTH domain [Sphingomonas vulcanisoli]|uniref:Transcriptional regulator with XRE-family HTH domain n=1 Tax=Sphingomonas vulcanisoli TaxID=1658060 RepID=A0ABX0TQC0_9SPHN|nr:RodZ domain-containing protein [Sphingomonas vulcanisoli]NIJ07697.1 transcriptional regulator with XRE-family HTH domain [Sphingomonas vulcanisoli]